jgi:ActR/RegA family two-component response regulator
MTDEASVEGEGVTPDARAVEESLLAGWPSWDDLRLRYLAAVLKHTGQNKTHAVKVLGIDRRTLNRILVRERKRGRWAP